MSPTPDYFLEHVTAAFLVVAIVAGIVVECVKGYRRRNKYNDRYTPSHYFKTAEPLHGMRGWQVGKAFSRTDEKRN